MWVWRCLAWKDSTTFSVFARRSVPSSPDSKRHNPRWGEMLGSLGSSDLICSIFCLSMGHLPPRQPATLGVSRSGSTGISQIDSAESAHMPPAAMVGVLGESGRLFHLDC